MTFLKTIAASNNIAIVCTIHQPSAPVFAGFDDALVLASGRVAYFGQAAKIGEHFTKLGQPLPLNCNPAEFVLDCVNKDFTSVAGVEAILDGWDAAAPPKPEFEVSDLPKPPRRANYVTQICVLLRRQLLLLVKDPSLYVARCVMNMVLVSIFAIVYLEARKTIQTQALQRCFFFVFCMAIPSQLSIGVVILNNFGLKSIAREVKDGMYNPVCQWIASSIVQAPMMILLAACALWPAFWGTQLPQSAFLNATLVFSAMLWTFEGLAEMFSLVKNPLNGMLYFLFFFIFAFLFCGMFVAFEDVVVVLRWICYVTPLGYTMRSMLYAIMSRTDDYDGALPCIPGETVEAFAPGNISMRVNCPERAFYCPEDPYFVSCFGVTGVQILDSIGVNFPVISGHDVYMGLDVLKVIAIGSVARLGYVIGLLFVTFSYKAVQSPKGDEANYSKHNGDIEMAAQKAAEEKGGDEGEPVAVAKKDGPRPVLKDPKTSFTFSNVSYLIKAKPFPKTPQKQILQGVSATVKAGDVLAILGPSGAGKTILLNTLTLEKGPGVPSGSVAINGHTINQTTYIQQCAYVPREDILWPSLTARQHLDTAAKLFRPNLGTADRAKMVDELLDSTGMTSCQHTKAGSAMIQGLSGGQRRRLSLALALVKRPRVVVLDEPTSGLDSAAAAAIMRLLKEMACQMGASIICTIHQPSSAVFDGFDQCLILSMGRAAYCGPAAELKTHFESIGKPLPEACNPAEFVLDEVSPEMSSKENVQTLLEAWSGKAPPITQPEKGILDKPPPTAGLCTQIMIITQRTISLALKDPTLYVSRMVLIAILICVFGLIYIESRDPTQDQVMPRLFLLNWVCTMPSILNLITVLALNTEYTNARTEMKSGMYSPIAYILATTLVQVPMMIVLSLCALVPGYLIGKWEWDGFLLMTIIYAANMWCFETMAQLFSLGSNAIFGMFNFIQIWSIALMFNGVVFRGQDVIGILRWMYFGFPLKWFMNALCYTILTPAQYTGVANCNFTGPSQPEIMACVGGLQSSPPSVLGCTDAGHFDQTTFSPYWTSVEDTSITMNVSSYTTMMEKSFGCSRGFYCPDASDPLQCFGATGPQILKTLNTNYESISEVDDRLLDVVVMLILAGAFKMMYIFFVLIDVKTRIMIREFLNLNSPGLVIVCGILVTVFALIFSGQEYGPVWL